MIIAKLFKLMIPSDNQEIDKVIKLRDVKTEEPFTLSEEGIVITDKLAELIDAKVGDTITVTTADDVEKEIKVVGVTENYISHYVYMSKSIISTSIWRNLSYKCVVGTG